MGATVPLKEFIDLLQDILAADPDVSISVHNWVQDRTTQDYYKRGFRDPVIAERRYGDVTTLCIE